MLGKEALQHQVHGIKAEEGSSLFPQSALRLEQLGFFIGRPMVGSINPNLCFHSSVLAAERRPGCVMDGVEGEFSPHQTLDIQPPWPQWNRQQQQ